MIDLSFEVTGARVEPHAAAPTIMFRIGVIEADGQRVHAAAIRTQVRIEPQKRQYGRDEEARLFEMFGETPRWGDTVRPFLWTHVSTTLPSFAGRTEIELPVECTYDFDVAAAKYLHSLDGGEVPLVFLFSGTAFMAGKGPSAPPFAAEMIGWDKEASFRMPASVWRSVMDMYFPNSSWIRIGRDTLDRLQRYKATRALPTWDQALEELLERADKDPRP